MSVIDDAIGQLDRARDRRALARWWDEHAATFRGLAEDELEAIVEALEGGDVVGARIEVARHMPASMFAAWQRDVIGEATEVGRARAKARAALEELRDHFARAVAVLLRALIGGA